MKMQEVTKLRKGDVVRFKWNTGAKTIDVVQVVTKEWSKSTNEYGDTGYGVATTGYPITCHNHHLFTKIG
jgi:ribosomal protein L14